MLAPENTIENPMRATINKHDKHIWETLVKDPPAFQWLEFFAGKGEATRMFRESFYRTGRLDIDYMRAEANCQNPMDLLAEAGFVFLSCKSF